MGTKLFPHNLFGNYIVEIAKLFKYRFINFQTTTAADVTPLNVYYGTPRAAFRYFLKKFNGVMILPVANFFGVDYRRRFDKECANPHLTMSDKRSYDPIDGTVTVTKPPMHFDITYQFSIYNNTMRERDRMIHGIMQIFPRGGCSLRWFPDKEDFPWIFLFMPLRIEESFIDETEIEGLEQKETRDIIKTNFNLISSAVLPYDVFRVPAVHHVLVSEYVEEDYREGLVRINLQLEDDVSWHTYFVPKTVGVVFSGNSTVAIDDYYYYFHKSYGLISASGSATVT